MACTYLSPREIESLYWISLGKTSWETASILGVSEHTINFHVRNICIKLDAPNRKAAIAIALSSGIIEPVKQNLRITSKPRPERRISLDPKITLRHADISPI